MDDELDRNSDSGDDPERESAPDSLIGTVLGGRYRVERRLGTGGMGAVYLAEHVHMKKPVAVKVLHPEMTAMEEMVLRFEREAIASARITHPNVVNATDFGKLPDGSFYLVLAYVAGTSLTELVEASGKLEQERACYIALQVAEALTAAHEVGVVHRDLKPDNVMIVQSADGAELVKVLDFGIAKLQTTGSGETQKLTRAGAIFGTPDYMSPEQAAGRAVDQRCDLYALGIMLYEMLTGEVPFHANEIMVLLTLHLTQPPPPLPSTVSSGLASLVMTLLEKEPEDRIQTAEEVAQRLRPFVTSARYRSGGSAGTGSSGRAPQIALSAASRIGAAASLGFRRTRRIAGRRVPLWQVLAGVAALSSLVWLVWRSGDDKAANPNAPISETALANAPAPATNSALPLDQAARGNAEALKALEAVAPLERGADVWFALGRGYSQTMDLKKSLSAYEEALKKDPSLAKNSQVARDLRDAADHPEAFKTAQRLAVEYLGELGVDLLFDVWADTTGKLPHTTNAKRELDTPSVWKHASAALIVAMELRKAQSCKGYQELLPRVRKFGDARSLGRVSRLQATEGCGFLGIEDCYGCLRGGNLLSTTIAAIKERPAPRF